MRVEYFSAECRLCEGTLSLLTARFPTLAITMHRASECRDGSCCALAEEYGVRAVPSLVVDGRVVQVGRPSPEDLDALAAVFERAAPAAGA